MLLSDFCEVVDTTIPVDIEEDYYPENSDIVFDKELLLKDSSLHEVYQDGRVRVIIARPYTISYCGKESDNFNWLQVFVYDYGVDSGWGCWCFDSGYDEIYKLGGLETFLYEVVVGEHNLFDCRGSSVATGIKKQA